MMRYLQRLLHRSRRWRHLTVALGMLLSLLVLVPGHVLQRPNFFWKPPFAWPRSLCTPGRRTPCSKIMSWRATQAPPVSTCRRMSGRTSPSCANS
jgi:hypothetical protein